MRRHQRSEQNLAKIPANMISSRNCTVFARVVEFRARTMREMILELKVDERSTLLHHLEQQYIIDCTGFKIKVIDNAVTTLPSQRNRIVLPTLNLVKW